MIALDQHLVNISYHIIGISAQEYVMDKNL